MMAEQLLQLLLIDDSPEDLLVMKRYISKIPNCRCEISEASDGLDGIKEFARRKDLDCIILDYSLPGKNGLEVLKELAANSAFEITPVVMVTGQGNENVAVQAMKLGAFDYLVKGEISEAAMIRVITNAAAKRRLDLRVIEEASMRAAAEMELQTSKLRNAELIGIQKTVVTVAHEINNPLTTLVLNLELLKDHKSSKAGGDGTQDDYGQLLAECMRTTLRIRDVVARLTNINEPAFRNYDEEREMLDLDNSK